LSDTFPIQNGPKQADALSPLLFNFALQHATIKVQENQVGLKLNGTHHLLVYADDVNLLGDNTNIIKKNTGALTDMSKDVGLEVNTEKTKYVLIPHHQNSQQNHNIKMANKTFKNVAKIKYQGISVTNQNLIHKKIKSRWYSGNTCYHSFRTSRLLICCLKM
jgi:hypothetical protein